MERNRRREKQVRSEKGKESGDIGSLTDSGIKQEMGGKIIISSHSSLYS